MPHLVFEHIVFSDLYKVKVTIIEACEAFDDVHEEYNKGEQREYAKYCGEQVDKVDIPLVGVGEMDAEKYNGQNHQNVDKVHNVHKRTIDNTPYPVGVANRKHLR